MTYSRTYEKLASFLMKPKIRELNALYSNMEKKSKKNFVEILNYPHLNYNHNATEYSNIADL